MRHALALLTLLGLAACAPRIPPPDQMSERDDDLTARIHLHDDDFAGGHDATAPASAISRLDRTLEQILDEHGPRSPAACQALTDAGVMLIEKDAQRTAVRYFERALAVCEATYGHEHRETSYALHDYAESMVLAARGRYEPRARPRYEEALAVRRRVLGELHAETGAAEVSLGQHILSGCRAEPPCQGGDLRLARALELARHAIAVFNAPDVGTRRDQMAASNLLIDIVAQRASSPSDSLPR